MLLYGIIILAAMIIVSLVNIFFNPMNLPWYHYVMATIVFTLAVMIIDGVTAAISRALPEKCIKKDSKFYSPSKKMINFYSKIGVRKWKDHIPELGQFTGFHKDKVANPNDIEYLERFILEASYGVLGHFLSIPLSFLVLFVDYGMLTNGSNLFLTVGLPVAVVSAVLNYMPYCVLRFNIPRLKNLVKLNKRNPKVS